MECASDLPNQRFMRGTRQNVMVARMDVKYVITVVEYRNRIQLVRPALSKGLWLEKNIWKWPCDN